MNKQEMKALAIEAIEARRADLIDMGQTLYAMPETGFREYKTSAYVKKALQNLGLSVQDGIGITGLCANAPGRTHGRRIAVMGELDALLMPSHPHADPDTGAAHACGHHTQLTMTIGAAIGLICGGVMPWLDGDVAFLAVPAEEVIELEYRSELANEGKIKFFGGKQEFIRLGVFDDVDAVLCAHLSNTGETGKFRHNASYNGVLHKIVRFVGKSSHAALAPQLGVNALHAALNAISNINSLRETLPEAEYARIHYIITKGGDSPNIIPDDVRMEFGVRAASAEYMLSLNERVNRAIVSGAQAIGAQAEITDMGAYLPTHQNSALSYMFAENAAVLVGADHVIDASGLHRCSSTDVGDVASLRPTIHPNFGGATGTPHTVYFDVVDDGFAYVEAAKAIAMTVIDLLADGGHGVAEIKEGFKPLFADKKAYLDYYEKLFRG